MKNGDISFFVFGWDQQVVDVTTWWLLKQKMGVENKKCPGQRYSYGHSFLGRSRAFLSDSKLARFFEVIDSEALQCWAGERDIQVQCRENAILLNIMARKKYKKLPLLGLDLSGVQTGQKRQAFCRNVWKFSIFAAEKREKALFRRFLGVFV